MQVQVVDEWMEIEKDYGLIDDEKIKNLIAESTRLNLDCLSTIDVIGDTYFQEKQSLQIKKKELEILRQKSSVDEKLLNTIQDAIDVVLSDGFLFLKFIGL